MQYINKLSSLPIRVTAENFTILSDIILGLAILFNLLFLLSYERSVSNSYSKIEVKNL